MHRCELDELERKRERVSSENDTLKSHANRFDREKQLCQEENARALEEKSRIESE